MIFDNYNVKYIYTELSNINHQKDIINICNKIESCNILCFNLFNKYNSYQKYKWFSLIYLNKYLYVIIF